MDSTRGAHGALNSAVARVLSDARESAGLTTRELAALSGIEHRTMMRYLYDERAIDMDRLDRLARAMRLDPSDVISRAAQAVAALPSAHSPQPAPLGSGVRQRRASH